MSTLEGMTAVVTGGAVGIGRQIAADLAREGASVGVLHHRTPPEDEHTADAQADVTDSAAVAAAMQALAGQLGGRIDILVANAGGLVGRVPVREMSDEHWRAVLDVNLSSAFYTVREGLKYMTSGGRIVFIGSQAGRDGGGPGATAYAAAKAGMIGLARGLAKELGPDGITVNVLAPGLILDTPFHPTFTPPDAQQASIARTPVGRAGYPADVSGIVTFLASEQASFITGAVIDVNGGLWLG